MIITIYLTGMYELHSYAPISPDQPETILQLPRPSLTYNTTTILHLFDFSMDVYHLSSYLQGATTPSDAASLESTASSDDSSTNGTSHVAPTATARSDTLAVGPSSFGAISVVTAVIIRPDFARIATQAYSLMDLDENTVEIVHNAATPSADNPAVNCPASQKIGYFPSCRSICRPVICSCCTCNILPVTLREVSIGASDRGETKKSIFW